MCLGGTLQCVHPDDRSFSFLLHLSSYLLSKLQASVISVTLVRSTLVCDTTGTHSLNPPSCRDQANQPTAKNLPVCLELLGTQASPGEDLRQRKVVKEGWGDSLVENSVEIRKNHKKGNGQK